MILNENYDKFVQKHAHNGRASTIIATVDRVLVKESSHGRYLGTCIGLGVNDPTATYKSWWQDWRRQHACPGLAGTPPRIQIHATIATAAQTKTLISFPACPTYHTTPKNNR